ncbi:MAG: M1 family aminopeptidase, partial [Candidatus Delongbacteria bacterium]
LKGICTVTIENKSDKSIGKIPFLLYRLMKVTSIQNQHGNELDFNQNIVSFSDFEKLQVNSIRINTNIEPKNTTTLKIQYDGYLLGYQETGIGYIKDRISKNFTLIRMDSYSYPILAEPSIGFLRKNIGSDNFTYKLSVTVPESLIVANGGHLLSKNTENSNTTYKYESKNPTWRIDISISTYQFGTKGRLDIFYLQNDSTIAKALLDQGSKVLKLYTQWWGELKNDNSITIIETEEGSGGQASETAILLPQESFTTNSYSHLYHELSHLWNVAINEKEGLSPRWEEGLATFCEYYVYEYLNTEKKGILDKDANKVIIRMKKIFDAKPKMYEIPMYEFGNKGLTDYSYNQGMVMFTVFYKLVGKEKFDLIVRSFYEQYHNSGATTICFTDLCEKVIQRKGVKKFFNDWIYTANYTFFIRDENTIDEIVKHYEDDFR